MSLNIKNDEVAALAREVATLANESQTEAIRVALRERRERLRLVNPPSKRDRARKLLAEKIWPSLPSNVRGKSLTKHEKERILGYGPHGV
jgi:antitoxin VapB